MKIFDQVWPFWSKVNFVDENNVFLGYDMETRSFEYAGWFIADVITNRIPNRRQYRFVENSRLDVIDMPGWSFDIEFFQEIVGECDDPDVDRFDTAVAVFRITNGPVEKFIHLFNFHNGYYKHGFSIKVGEKKPKKAEL